MMKSLFFIQIRIRYLKFIENIMLRMADEITIFLPLCFYWRNSCPKELLYY